MGRANALSPKINFEHHLLFCIQFNNTILNVRAEQSWGDTDDMSESSIVLLLNKPIYIRDPLEKKLQWLIF